MPSNEHTEITHREPTDGWTELDRLFDDLRGRFYGSLGLFPFGVALEGRPGGKAPRYLRAAPTDITDTGRSFKVTAEIPGIPKEKLEIHVAGSSVEIRGETEETSAKKDGDFVHRERTYQGFYRAFELPEPVVPTDAKATIVNGVLELDLPKQVPTPSPEPVKVPVQ